MKKVVDLRIPPGQHTSAMQAMGRIEDYITIPAIAEAIALWPRMPEEVRELVRTKYPLFRRLQQLGALWR